MSLEVTSSPLDMANRACQQLMNTFAPGELPPANRWHYHQGVFLYGMQKVYEKTGNKDYYDYIKGYVDHLIDEEGNLYFARDELDSIQAGILLFPIYEDTKERRYKIAADKLRSLYNTLNRTTEGGFWHKDKYPYQIWMDGLFMGGPFALLYAKHFDEPELVDMVMYQYSLMEKHLRDEKTGLFYHAWDEKKQQPWADSETGLSPEFWGRSTGWFGAAAIDILDLLPEDTKGREDLLKALIGYIDGIIKFQDEKTGLWYEVVDKGDREDNWLESSCTSLFVYTIAAAVERGYVGKEYLQYAVKGYNGLVEHMVEMDDETWKHTGICIGTSAGTYDYYVGRPTSENDLHGVGAFIMACMELEKVKG